MVVLKELYGHSGCKVSLIKSKGKYEEDLFVRKISKDQEYNLRLEKQFFKQNSFNHRDIKSPHIYSSGFCGDLFYFDMEYVLGSTLSSLMTENQLDIDEAVDFVVSHYKLQYQEKLESNDVKNAYCNKIDELNALKHKFPFVKNLDHALVIF